MSEPRNAADGGGHASPGPHHRRSWRREIAELAALFLAVGLAHVITTLLGHRDPGPVVLVGLGVDRTLGELYRPAPRLGPPVWNGPVCRQSTTATCAPAAVASALAAVGVRADEASMCRAALTTRNGTSNLGMYRALRVALDGKPFAVTVFSGSAADLAAFPAVVSLEMQGVAQGTLPVGARHAVAILGRDAGRFLVADPFVGLLRWPPDRLASMWTGHAFVVQKFP